MFLNVDIHETTIEREKEKQKGRERVKMRKTNGREKNQVPHYHQATHSFQGKTPKDKNKSSPLSCHHHHHHHLHHPPPPPYIVSLSFFFSSFSFPSLYNCFFTWKRRTFPTVEGSFPISHFLALGFGHGHFSHASPTKEQGSPHQKGKIEVTWRL